LWYPNSKDHSYPQEDSGQCSWWCVPIWFRFNILPWVSLCYHLPVWQCFCCRCLLGCFGSLDPLICFCIVVLEILGT
jgi:hypothetical protein